MGIIAFKYLPTLPLHLRIKCLPLHPLCLSTLRSEKGERREERMKIKRPPKQQLHLRRPLELTAIVLAVVLCSCIGYKYNSLTLEVLSESSRFHPKKQFHRHYNHSYKTKPPAALSAPSLHPRRTVAMTVDSEMETGPYHNWGLFVADFEDMMRHLKIFVYPDVFNRNNPFANIFLPHPNPFENPKLANYFSEHMFKVALLRSSLMTQNPEEAHFFFLPFSINNLRNDARVHSESSIAEFVAHYTNNISHRFRFWNASKGADHFFVCCHSVGRDAVSKHPTLHNNAIQLTCSSSYFQRFYTSHKDVGLPQVRPRPNQPLNPPHGRHRLVYFVGRAQNSRVRQELINLWGNDSEIDIFAGNPPFPYEEGFKRSKYCLQVKGYEVNTARVSDAIHYGCVPVIVSNYYDLPFANVLDWTKFSIVINHGDIAFLKARLLGITRKMYLKMYRNLCEVRRHFQWHSAPRGYDSFYMTAYQLWLRRSIHRLSY